MMSAVVVPLIIATLATGLAVSEYVAPGLVPVPKFLNASPSSSAPRSTTTNNARPQSNRPQEEKKEPSWSQVRPAAAAANANANSRRNAPAPLQSPPPPPLNNNAAATRNSGRKNGGIEGLPNFEPVFR